jgi:excisionase family DNA binding protein
MANEVETFELLTKQQVSQLGKVSVAKVEREIARGRLRAVKWGRHCRISTQAFRDFVGSLEAAKSNAALAVSELADA